MHTYGHEKTMFVMNGILGGLCSVSIPMTLSISNWGTYENYMDTSGIQSILHPSTDADSSGKSSRNNVIQYGN